MLMLAEYGTLSLAEVLGPSIELADGYPIEAETADRIERWRDKLKEWPYSKQLSCRTSQAREAPHRRDLTPERPRRDAAQLVEPRRRARRGQSREAAIQAAYDRSTAANCPGVRAGVQDRADSSRSRT